MIVDERCCELSVLKLHSSELGRGLGCIIDRLIWWRVSLFDGGGNVDDVCFPFNLLRSVVVDNGSCYSFWSFMLMLMMLSVPPSQPDLDDLLSIMALWLWWFCRCCDVVTVDVLCYFNWPLWCFWGLFLALGAVRSMLHWLFMTG